MLRYLRILQSLVRLYPRQFWLLFWGMLISTIGSSMVWPFLTIFLRQKLGLPMTNIALLMTINSVASLVTTSIAGPVADRFGRKGVMLLSMSGGAVVSLAMSAAGTYTGWAILMGLNGAFSPLFRVGSDSMVADLIEPERRPEAYSLVRMVQNLGIAIGPAVGGFVAAASYNYAFYAAAAGAAIFFLLILFFVRESLQPRPAAAHPLHGGEGMDGGGYGHLLRDRLFLSFVGIYSLAVMAYSMMMVLLPVYAKENFGVPEQRYGFIMGTNALMVVLFQYVTTRYTRRFKDMRVLAVGALFYAVGIGSIALGKGFEAFLLSIVIITIGEMMLVPTSTALTANLAPPAMRGRYMSVYSLTWAIGLGLGPVIGGLLNDYIAPVAIWYGGLAMCLASVLGFIFLSQASRRPLDSATPV